MSFHDRPSQAIIDLRAIAANVEALRARVGQVQVMAVVKADGYGHGLLPSALAALAGGATWLGTAHPDEALTLRAAGITPREARILTWIHTPSADFGALIEAQVDISVSSPEVLERIAQAALEAGQQARIHLKVDTGLGRNGLMPAALPAVAERAAELQTQGAVSVVGVWSHLAFADDPGHPTIAAQQRVFEAACKTLADAGLDVEVRHLANSAATLTVPEMHYDLVRPGLAVYGLSPLPDTTPADFGLTPAMTLQAQLATVKDAPAGHGVSYGHLYHTATDTKLGVVPLGYADGIPRHASGGSAGSGGPVLVGDGASARVLRIAGRVCMDQFVLDLGPDATEQAGDTVTLFGSTYPTAEEWGQAADTISYEITTRLGAKVPRVYAGLEVLDPRHSAAAVPFRHSVAVVPLRHSAAEGSQNPADPATPVVAGAQDDVAR